MRSSLRNLLIAAGGAAVLVSGLLPAKAPASGAAAPKVREPAGEPRSGLSAVGPYRPKPETFGELAAANAAFGARHAGFLGESFAAARLAAFARAKGMPAALDPALGRAWKELGPKPFYANDNLNVSELGWDVVSGRVQVVTPDPTDPTGNKVWIGLAGGGAWYTTDGGKTWTPKFDRMPSLAVGAIAVDPANPRTVFVGTGDAHNCGGCYAGVGVYRSTDNGATWTRVPKNVKRDAAVSRIEIAAGRIFVSTNRGLFRSTDGGNSYHDVLLPTNAAGTAPDSGIFGNIVSDMHVKPRASDEIWAAVGYRAGKKGSKGNGLYRSTQGGAPGTWARVATEGFGTPGRSDDPIGRITFAFAPQDPNIMWALIQDAGLFNNETFIGMPLAAKTNILNGVYRSGDGGATWDLKATSEVFQTAPGSGLVLQGAVLYAPGVQSWYNQWIAVDPSDNDRVLVGLEEIYETTSNANGEGLATWETVGRYWNSCLLLVALPPCDEAIGGPYTGKTTHPDQHAAAMISTPQGTLLYAANDGGMYKQVAGEDGFDNQSWTSLNDTLGTTQAYYAVIGRDDTVYAGFQDNGTAKISPNGHASMVYGGDGFDVAVHPNDSKIAYEEYVGGAMRVTTDGGKTWRSISPGLASPLFSTPFEMDPLDPNHLVIGGRNIRETTLGPDTCDGGFCYWATAFDLGYNEKVYSCGVPLENCPENLETLAPNQMSAVDVVGPRVFVGFCGVCDIITQGSMSGNPAEFQNGIATNIKDGCTPTTATWDVPLVQNDDLPRVGVGRPIRTVIGPELPESCWHKIVRPTGLPNRYITDVEIDPSNPKTIYVTLAGYARKWLPPDASTPGVGKGNVFVSRDGGKSFADLSGNLPDSPASAVVVAGDRLIVGTDVGVFVAPKSGGAWAKLGGGLPDAYVVDLNLNPQGTKLVAATFGRGVWLYDLAGAPATKTRTKVLGERTSLPATGVDPATGVGGALLLSSFLIRRRVKRR